MFLLYLYSVREHKCLDCCQIGHWNSWTRSERQKVPEPQLGWFTTTSLWQESQSCLLKYFGADEVTSVRLGRKFRKSATLNAYSFCWTILYVYLLWWSPAVKVWISSDFTIKKLPLKAVSITCHGVIYHPENYRGGHQPNWVVSCFLCRIA